MKKHDRDLLAEEGEALRKELRERTKGMTNFEDRLPETLRADIDLCRRDIDHIGERLNKLERPATYTPEETFSRAVRGEHEAIVEYLMSEEDAVTPPVPDKLERPAAVTTRDLLDEQDQAEQLGAFREREAIVKWLRDGDRSCDCCGLTREVNPIEGSPIDFDQLCPECHFTKRHIAKSIEDGDHL